MAASRPAALRRRVRTADPRASSVSACSARDLVSFMKARHVADNPMPASATPSAGVCRRAAVFCATSCIRASTRRAGAARFDGVFDQVAAPDVDRSTTGSASASRDALQYFNILSPRSLPLRRRTRNRSGTGVVDKPAPARRENRNRAEDLPPADELGILQSAPARWVHTDPTGTKDADLPAKHAVYMIASARTGPVRFRRCRTAAAAWSAAPCSTR